MLDMSFQLLSFFVITFKPMPTEGQMAMNLPKLDGGASNNVTSDPITDQKDEYKIQLYVDSTGKIATMGISGPTNSKDDISGNDMYKILEKQLNEIVGSVPKAKIKDQISLTIEADEKLIYSEMIFVMDMCRAKGIESMSMTPLKKQK
jgi:biopolymer transport protein ExbD